MNRERLKEYITGHEGRRNRAYPDGNGIMTVGIGMNLEEERNKQRIVEAGLDYAKVCAEEIEVDDDLIDFWFNEDLNTAISDATSLLVEYWRHPEEVQLAIVDMAYQLGAPRLKKFRNMLSALNIVPPDYLAAADEIANSLYARQAPNRALDNIELIRRCALG